MSNTVQLNPPAGTTNTGIGSATDTDTVFGVV